jgi:transcriptional regulator with XRE-family HTH domain
MTTGSRFADLRARAGLKTKDVYTALGVNETTLWHWERSVNLAPRHVVALRAVLGDLISQRITYLADLHDEVQAVVAEDV